MKNKKNILIVSLLLLICVGSLSYAYFTSKNDIGELNDSNIEEQTANLNGTIVTLAGETLKAESSNVYPGHKEIVKLTVSALHNNGPVNYNLEWVGTNTLTSEVTYKIYKSEKDLKPTIVCETVSVGGMEEIHYYEECDISNFGTLESDGTYQEGTIVYANVEETQTLLYNEEITGEDPAKLVYYYVVIEYVNDEDKSQDGDAEHGYNGHFRLNNVKDGTKVKKVNTSIGVLDINLDKPNFRNISCLKGTNSENHTEGNCEEETNGIYEETTSLGKTYYYRGSVNNNWVKFGKTGGTKGEGEDIWWRIIRINEDGTIRLIYAGEGEQAPASPEQVGGQGGYWMSNSYGIDNIGYAFNKSVDYNAYVGYMYGKENSETFNTEHGYDLIDAETPELLKSSDIKNTIYDWYEKNLQDEGNILSGYTGFCGDRSLALGYEETGFGNQLTYYKAYDRVRVDFFPSFECPDSAHDLYTTKTDKGKGNGALDYPIGLIAVDEMEYAGGTTSSNYGYWLRVGQNYWTLSPNYFSGSYARTFFLNADGNFGTSSVDRAYGVRVVVNLKASALTTEEKDGTIENPYIVEV